MPVKQSAKKAATPTINFAAKLFAVNAWTILRLPDDASTKLPSRSQAFVEGDFNGIHFQTPLEPDGRWRHWFKVDKSLLTAANVAAGDTVQISISPMAVWPEPEVPADIKRAISSDPKAHDLWKRITTMARWEWIRWIRSTNRQETRDHRIEVAISKMKAGERRPCCWNRNLSTEPAVSKNGVLLEPEQSTGVSK